MRVLPHTKNTQYTHIHILRHTHTHNTHTDTAPTILGGLAHQARGEIDDIAHQRVLAPRAGADDAAECFARRHAHRAMHVGAESLWGGECEQGC